MAFPQICILVVFGSLHCYCTFSNCFFQELESMGSVGQQQLLPHALVIPVGMHGHWSPMKLFIHRLLDSGISLTIIGSRKRILELQALKLQGRFGNLDHVELVEVFSEPPVKNSIALDQMVNRMYEEWTTHPSVMQKLVAQRSSGSGPTFVISDMFLYWAQHIADELGIQRYSFFTSPSYFALVFQHVPTLLARGWHPGNPDQLKGKEVVDVAGLQKFRAGELPHSLYETASSYHKHSRYLHKAAGIVINSFEQYEADEVLALKTELQSSATDGKGPKVFLIGPLLRDPTFSNGVESSASPPGKKEEEKPGCLQFLDSKSANSVLYICFGTVRQPSQSATRELARGLELSEVPFLWVIPAPEHAPSLCWNAYDSLPVGFESQTKGRGLVWTSWSPQKEVLEHPSIGGFICHCGWNSILETLRATVPIIVWPLGGEQAMNARFIVSVAKVGVEINKTVEGEILGEEVANAIRLLMASETGKDLKARMQELSRTAEAAAADGGSSFKALRAFLQEVETLAPARISN